VVGLVLGRGFRLTIVGAIVGLVLALGAGQVLQRTFQGVNGIDPLTFASIALLLALVVVAASWFPASRAARLQPSSILRER
jgi:ABC-type antimicrobial peptide transport system permease subunit